MSRTVAMPPVKDDVARENVTKLVCEHNHYNGVHRQVDTMIDASRMASHGTDDVCLLLPCRTSRSFLGSSADRPREENLSVG